MSLSSYKCLALLVFGYIFIIAGCCLFNLAVDVKENSPYGSFRLRFSPRQNMNVQNVHIEIRVPNNEVKIITDFNFTKSDIYKLYITLPYLTKNVSVHFGRCKNKPILNFINLTRDNKYGFSVINVTYIPSSDMEKEEWIEVSAKIKLGDLGVISRSEMAKKTIIVPLFGRLPHNILSKEQYELLNPYYSGLLDEFRFPELFLSIEFPPDSTLLTEGTFPTPITWIASDRKALWIIKASEPTIYIQTVICSYSDSFSKRRDLFIFLAGALVSFGISIFVEMLMDWVRHLQIDFIKDKISRYF